MATIIGTAQTDFLVGLATADLIFGEAGNDVLLGAAGNDQLYGGLGVDRIRGGLGNDRIDGGDDNDLLMGEAGNDLIFGGLGNDILEGGEGNDRLEGGEGNDLLYGGTGTDFLSGGAGRDGFVLAPGWGGSTLTTADRILDFQLGQDSIRLGGGLQFQGLTLTAGTGVLTGSTIIRVRATGEYLAIVSGVTPNRLAAFNFFPIALPVPDVTLPTFANFQVSNITRPNLTTQTFTIQYADAGGLDLRSIDNQDILVTGPGGYRQFATRVNLVRNSSTTATAAYRITAPGGTWDATDDGTYQVVLRGGEVFDISGNFIPGTTLGNFQVSVPPPIVPVTVTVTPTSIEEDSGTTMVFTVTRSTFVRDPITINIELGGTALRGTDYTIIGGVLDANGTGSITLPAGQTSGAIIINPVRDNVTEPDETVTFTLRPGTGYQIEGEATTTATIIDDEAQISLAIAPEAVLENSDTDLVYTFTRTGFVGRNITVGFTLGGTANASDYTVEAPAGTTFTITGTTGTLTFAPGDTTRELRFRPIDDTQLEPDETVALALSNGVGYQIQTTTPLVGTIQNDESTVSVAVAPGNVLEDGPTGLVYTFTRNGFTGAEATVNFTVEGSANPGGDYGVTSNNVGFSFTGTTGTLTFAPGETTQTVTVTPTPDNISELDETVVLTVTDGTNYLIGANPTATGTITNDESSIALAIAPEAVLEDSNTPLTVTFTRSGFLNRAVTVEFSATGDAVLGTDYTVGAPTGTNFTFDGSSGTVTFGPGVTSRTLTFTPIANSERQPDRTLSLAVEGGTGYEVETDTPVVGTITDDDAEVTLSVSPNAVREDSGQGIVYTFTRQGYTEGPLTVNFSVLGTALFGPTGDYTVTSNAQGFTFNGMTGTLTFEAGQATATLTVLSTSDLLTIEADETVSLTLATGTGYSVGTATAVTGTILNDDGIVTNTNDSGAGSLRQAILAANNGASLPNPTITFEGAGASGVIDLETALPAIARNMIINGPGAASLTVSRNSSDEFRIFTINAGVTAVLRGMTLDNGAVTNGNGGAILNNGGDLTVENSLVTNSDAIIGGGIYHDSGTLTLRNTVVSNNTATSADGGAGGGLGIGTGTVNLFEGTSFVNNFAEVIGGGVYNTSAQLNMTGTPTSRVNFAGNRTNGFGGGLYNNTGEVTIQYGNFQNNRANTLIDSGGGIFNDAGSLSIGNTLFNNIPLNLPNAIAGNFADLGGNTGL